MDPIVEVRNVSKIFGKSPKAALELLKKGRSKKIFLKKLDKQLVSIRFPLRFILEKSSSLWGCLVVENPH